MERAAGGSTPPLQHHTQNGMLYGHDPVQKVHESAVAQKKKGMGGVTLLPLPLCLPLITL